MSLSKRSGEMQLDADPKILTAIENAVAASRWRTAARFEGRETAAQFRRNAAIRARAATRALTDFAGTIRRQPDRSRTTHAPDRGAE
jgi:hypothetical protein